MLSKQFSLNTHFKRKSPDTERLLCSPIPSKVARKNNKKIVSTRQTPNISPLPPPFYPQIRASIPFERKTTCTLIIHPQTPESPVKRISNARETFPGTPRNDNLKLRFQPSVQRPRELFEEAS